MLLLNDLHLRLHGMPVSLTETRCLLQLDLLSKALFPLRLRCAALRVASDSERYVAICRAT